MPPQDNPFAQFREPQSSSESDNPFSQFRAPSDDESTPDPRVPIYMRGNPGLTPPRSTLPSRDIPSTTREQLENRRPGASLGDWASFAMDSLLHTPVWLRSPESQRQTQERMARIHESLFSQDADRNLGEVVSEQYPLSLESAPRDISRRGSTALGFMLDQNEEHRASILRQQYPDGEFRRDEHGYLQFRYDPQGNWIYINRPGVSPADAVGLAETLWKFLPASRVSALPANLSGRALTATTLSGATEWGAQQLAKLFGGDGPDLADVSLAAAGGGGGQLLFDTLLGVTPALAPTFRRMLGIHETPRAPLPDPPLTPGSTPESIRPFPARTESATRGTAEEIEALEREIQALRDRGPSGLRDPNDRHVVDRYMREESSPTPAPQQNQWDDYYASRSPEEMWADDDTRPTPPPPPRADDIRLSEGNSVQQQQARQRHAEHLAELEARLQAARTPVGEPVDIPLNSDVSDRSLDAAVSAVRANRIPADAADPLSIRVDERLRRRILSGGLSGDFTGVDPTTIRTSTNSQLSSARNALLMVDRLAADIRAGTVTFKQAQQVRNALRHFETIAVGEDRATMQRLMFGFDEWLNRSLSTQRAVNPGLAQLLDSADLSVMQRGASMARRDLPPEAITPPPTPPSQQRATRQQVRAAFDEQNIRGSRGQISQDIRALQREDDLIQQGDPEAQRFVNTQAEDIQRRANELATRGAPPLSRTVDEAGEALQADIQRRFQELDDLADDTYKRAFNLLREQRVISDAGESLRNNVDTRLTRGPGSTDDPLFQYEDTGLRWEDISGGAQTNYPNTREALRIIERLADDVSTGNINFAIVARRRQNLNALAASAHGADMRALRNVRHGFDEWLNAQLTRQQTARIFSPDEATEQAALSEMRAQALALHNEANAIWGERQQLFSAGNSRDYGGAVIERIRDPQSGMTGTQVINSIFGAGKNPPLSALNAVRRIRRASMETDASGRLVAEGERTAALDAFDNGSLLTPQMQALREAFWHRIMQPLTKREPGRLVPARAIANNLDAALNGPGAAITRQLNTPAEIEQMRRLLQVLKYIERPPGANTSGTAFALRRMLTGAVDGIVPGISRGIGATLRVFGLLAGRNIDEIARTAESASRFRRPRVDIDFGSSPSGAAYGQVLFHKPQESRRPSPDPATRDTPPVGRQERDPMAGVEQVRSLAAGTVTFWDGQQWVTLPTTYNGVPIGVTAAVSAWRDGRIRALSTDDDYDSALASAQSYRSQEAPIDRSRPIIENNDGTFSTERTITIEQDGYYFNIPTIVSGREVSEDDAVRLWRAGQNPEVGRFRSLPEAERAAQARSQEIGRVRAGDRRTETVP